MTQSLNEDSKHQDEQLRGNPELDRMLLEETLLYGTHKNDDKDVYVCDIDYENNLITIMSCDNSIFEETLTDVSIVELNDFLKQNNL